jgi:hypothetical protein
LSGACLDPAEDQLALNALELLADLDRAPLEADGGPVQAKGLAATQAAEDEEHERRVQRVGPGSSEELLGLVGGPGPDGGALPLRQFDQAGDVARD